MQVNYLYEGSVLRFRNAIYYWPYPFNGDRQDEIIVPARDHSQDRLGLIPYTPRMLLRSSQVHIFAL